MNRSNTFLLIYLKGKSALSELIMKSLVSVTFSFWRWANLYFISVINLGRNPTVQYFYKLHWWDTLISKKIKSAGKTQKREKGKPANFIWKRLVKDSTSGTMLLFLWIVNLFFLGNWQYGHHVEVWLFWVSLFSII